MHAFFSIGCRYNAIGQHGRFNSINYGHIGQEKANKENGAVLNGNGTLLKPEL